VSVLLCTADLQSPKGSERSHVPRKGAICFVRYVGTLNIPWQYGMTTIVLSQVEITIRIV
jgi:hypothetical protein